MGNQEGLLGSRKVFKKDYIPLTEPVKVMDHVSAFTCGYTAAFAIKPMVTETNETFGSIYGWGRFDSPLLYWDMMVQAIGGTHKTWTDLLGQKRSDQYIVTPLSVTFIPPKLPTDGGPSVPAVLTVGDFIDVKSTDYFANAVQWAVEKNITSGTSKTTFSPDATCNRAQILSFLWRASGSPEPTAANPFSDITSTDYFYKAALWAAEKGMVSGSSFGASTPCTRASTMEYMWKAAGSPAVSYNGKFDDVSTSADYAQAVAWAVENKITAGTSKTTFGPDSTCTRGQIVTFLHRAMGD